MAITFDTIEQMAKQVIDRQGHHAPQFILIHNDKADIILIPNFTSQTKGAVNIFMRKVFQKKRPIRYYYIGEVWMKTVEKAEDFTRRPSEFEDRRDGLIIMEFNNDMTSKGVTYEIIKENGIKPKLVNRQSMKTIDTWFNFYLEDVMNEKINQEFKKRLESERDGK